MPRSFCPLHVASGSTSFAGLRRLADCLPAAKIAVWRSAFLTDQDCSFLVSASTFCRHIDQKVIHCNMNPLAGFVSSLFIFCSLRLLTVLKEA